MKIGKQVRIDGRFHVAMMNPHERSAGAILCPVVCFMVITDSNGDDHIAPFITDPENTDAALLPALMIGEEDFVALVEPGKEIDTWFNDMADERLKIESEPDNKKDREKAAKEAHASLSGHQRSMLKNMNAINNGERELAEFGTRDDLFTLAGFLLIAPSRYNGKTIWHCTALGTAVCHLDR